MLVVWRTFNRSWGTIVKNAETALLIATNNSGKLVELRRLLCVTSFDLLSLKDVGIVHEVAETGTTFEENALLKASTYSGQSGMLTLADDSGLEVDALDGAPGVLSARFAGADATDQERNEYLLDRLIGVRGRLRSARFRCVLALASPGAPTQLFEGECRGHILQSPRGSNGFGYDPIFLLEGSDKTTAELSPDEKNAISHRGKAACKVVRALEERTSNASMRR